MLGRCSCRPNSLIVALGMVRIGDAGHGSYNISNANGACGCVGRWWVVVHGWWSSLALPERYLVLLLLYGVILGSFKMLDRFEENGQLLGGEDW